MQGTVGVPVRAETVRLVIAPLALVLVTICVNQSTVAIDSVANDVSFVQAAIGPDQHAIPLTYQLFVNDAPLSTVALPSGKDLQLAQAHVFVVGAEALQLEASVFVAQRSLLLDQRDDQVLDFLGAFEHARHV